VGTVARDSLRVRGTANGGGIVGVGTGLTGESGTVGKMSRGVGLRLAFDKGRWWEESKVALKAVTGTGFSLKEGLEEDVEGGGSGGWGSPSLEASDGK
jgi:hypothetical protein